MPFTIYWLISEDKGRTYVGFSDNINRRVKEHISGRVRTTKLFRRFRCFKIDSAENKQEAMQKEKYWKSHAGRNKLKKYFDKIISELRSSHSASRNKPPSSSG